MEIKIIKIDRVKSSKEALEFQNLGFNLIGVSLSKNKLFDDDRYVSIETAMEIRETLNKSKLVLELRKEDCTNFEFTDIKKIKADYIQLVENEIPNVEFINTLINQNIKIIWSGISASYEDDPSWLLSGHSDIPNLHPSFFQIDLLADVNNSWSFFKTESPNYPEELQIEDINNLGKEFPLLITSDFTTDNVNEIIISLNEIKGINFILGSNAINNNFHYFNYDTIIKIMKSLNK